MSFFKRVLIIANYASDNQQSMLRFAGLLAKIYSSQVFVFTAFPPCLFGRIPFIPLLARKYLAYVDKLILFPLWIAFFSRCFDCTHIADHSNAFYAFFCPRGRCLITCHDLLAVRGAYGDASAACQASPIGFWLQRLVVAGLRYADSIAFVSNATQQDFHRLIGVPSSQRHVLIPNPLNASFSPDLSSVSIPSAEVSLVPQAPFLLMVGSALPRKNRALALRLLVQLGRSSPYRLVFAGEPLTLDEQTFRASHPFGDRLVSISGPSHALLNLLYCRAHALLFPSFSEGFGWPIVEAQVCRCPVIASRTTSIPEVAAAGALYADPTDVSAFAMHVQALEDSATRDRLIALGVENSRRFDFAIARDAYLDLAQSCCT